MVGVQAKLFSRYYVWPSALTYPLPWERAGVGGNKLSFAKIVKAVFIIIVAAHSHTFDVSCARSKDVPSF